MGDASEPSSEPELLRAYLADRDVPCPVCGYNLRGLDSEACPECGARLRLHVGSMDLRLGAWLMLMLSVGLPFGFFAINLVGNVVLSYVWESDLDAVVIVLLVGACLFGGALACVVVKRRNLWTRRSHQQRRVAVVGSIISWLLAVTLILVMVSMA